MFQFETQLKKLKHEVLTAVAKLAKEDSVTLNNIEKIILNNNCYITPKIDLNGDNYAAIYGEMIYLYLTAIEFRENKNEYSK